MKELIKQLLYEEESTTLDFKEEQYVLIDGTKHQKCEFLKDILAFANAWRREDSYILIGVKDIKGGRSIVVGISEDDKLDDANLQQMVNQKLNKPIHFEYKNISIDNKIIGVIKIPLENNARPFYLKNDCEHIKMNEVKIRRGTSTETATPDEIIEMSKDRIKQEDSPILVLEFADNINKKVLGKNLEIESEFWNIGNADDIPSYQSNARYNDFKNDYWTTNSEYYKELINYHQLKKLCVPVSFSLFNDSNILATDIKIEIELEGNIIKAIRDKEFPEKPKNSHNYLMFQNINRLTAHGALPDILIEKRNDIWYLELIFKKIQPKQRIFSNDLVYFAAKGETLLKYKIYADNLPEPINENLSIKHSIEKINMNYEDALEYAGIDKSILNGTKKITIKIPH